MNAKPARAKPLSRKDRRQAIVAAIIPLLMEKGATVTTAELADAAGIAEGTIFRAFPDKAALLHEAVKATMDPRPVREALAQIPDDLPIEAQLAATANVLSQHFERIAALVGMLRSMPHPVGEPSADSHRFAADSLAQISAALTTIMERHRDHLLIEPGRAAVALRGLIFTNAHPLLTSGEKLSTDEIVTVLLSGVVSPSGRAD